MKGDESGKAKGAFNPNSDDSYPFYPAQHQYSQGPNTEVPIMAEQAAQDKILQIRRDSTAGSKTRTSGASSMSSTASAVWAQGFTPPSTMKPVAERGPTPGRRWRSGKLVSTPGTSAKPPPESSPSPSISVAREAAQLATQQYTDRTQAIEQSRATKQEQLREVQQLRKDIEARLSGMSQGSSSSRSSFRLSAMASPFTPASSIQSSPQGEIVSSPEDPVDRYTREAAQETAAVQKAQQNMMTLMQMSGPVDISELGKSSSPKPSMSPQGELSPEATPSPAHRTPGGSGTGYVGGTQQHLARQQQGNWQQARSKRRGKQRVGS